MNGKRQDFVLILGCATALLLTGCGSSDEEERVGSVTATEAQALNEASSMLDTRMYDTPSVSAENKVDAAR